MALRLIDLEAPELPAAQPIDTSAMEVDMGDQAGLQPLPIGRMFRQAGRPMSPQSRGQLETQRLYGWDHFGASTYGKNKSLKVDPALHDLTIKRNQKAQQTIENWDPIGAENKQRLNNTNPKPRSKPSAPDDKTTLKFFQNLAESTNDRMIDAFQSSVRAERPSGMSYANAVDEGRNVRYKSDKSDFLTPQERNAAKSVIFTYLDRASKGRTEASVKDLPFGVRDRFPGLSNDMVYEWNARRTRQMREGTLDMLEIRRDTIRGI